MSRWCIIPSRNPHWRLFFWGIAYRYPGPEDVPEPLPSDEDIEQTISNIEALAARLQQLIGS